MLQMGQSQQLNLEHFQTLTTVSHLSGPKLIQHSKKKGSLDIKSRKTRDGSILGPQTSIPSQDLPSSSLHLDSSNASSSIRAYTDSSKSDNSLKRLPKKKKRKKTKRNLKTSDGNTAAAVHEENAEGFTVSGPDINMFSGSEQILTNESLQDVLTLDTCFKKNYKNYDDVKTGETYIISGFIQEVNELEGHPIPKSKGTISSAILSRENSGTRILQSDNYVYNHSGENYIHGSAEILAASGQNAISNAQIEESIHQLRENDDKHCSLPSECRGTIEMTGVLASISSCDLVKHCTDQLSSFDAQEPLEQSRDAEIASVRDHSGSSVTNGEAIVGSISGHNCVIIRKEKRVPGSHGIGKGTSSSVVHTNDGSARSSFEGAGGFGGNCWNGGMYDRHSDNGIEMAKDIMIVDNHERNKHSIQTGRIREIQADSYDRKVRVAGGKKVGGNSNGMDGSSSGSSHSFDIVNAPGRYGKENNHSIWQKVQRSIEDGHTCEPKATDCVQLQSDAASQDGSLVAKCTTAESKSLVHLLPASPQEYSNSEHDPKEQKLKELEIHKECVGLQGPIACNDVQSRFTMQPDLPNCQAGGDCTPVCNLPVVVKERQNVGNIDMHAMEAEKGYRAKKMVSSRSGKLNQFFRKGSLDASQQSNQPKSFCSDGRNLQHIPHWKVEVRGTYQGDQLRSSSAPPTPHIDVDTLQASRCIFPFGRSSAPMEAMLSQMLHLSRTSKSANQEVPSTRQESNPIISNGKTLEATLGIDENSLHSPLWKGSKSAKLAMEFSQKNMEQDCTSQEVSQKRVPTERKSTGVFRASTTDKVGVDSPDKVFSLRRANDGKQKEYDSSDQSLASLGNPLITHASTTNNFHKGASENDESVARDYVVGSAVTSQETGTSSSGDVEQITTAKNGYIYEAPCRCLSDITCDLSSPDRESKRVSQAVLKAIHASYHYQLASEDIACIIGSPLAEFEKVLHCMSPAIGSASHIEECCSHSRNQLMRNVVCGCQVANILLKDIWHWYEKPGNYGLEVKAEDFQHSERLGIDRNLFRAYFVPFLSGMQLFGASASQSVCRDSQSSIKQGRIEETEKVEDSYLPQFGNLPILATLLPKPSLAEETSLPVCSDTIDTSDSSPRDKNHWCNAMPEDFNFGDIDLLFEYFESEQPQQRRPIFEKIQELAKSHSGSSSQAFGDPHILESIKLQDLHPASWFSVAWYPIYRIPEGHLRAAFLTYHSLSHFVYRSTSPNALDGCTDCCIVAPVVGLRSYNTQAECWFVPKTQLEFVPEEGMPLNPVEVLRERLRTLEETASMMARGFTRKGTASITCKQSDYEFFLNRRRFPLCNRDRRDKQISEERQPKDPFPKSSFPLVPRAFTRKKRHFRIAGVWSIKHRRYHSRVLQSYAR